jgi:superfamily II DNA or RNA helicase
MRYSLRFTQFEPRLRARRSRHSPSSSKAEEAQRLGRILRPKADGRTAHFFSLVSRDTREEEFAHHRQLFLTEQGYSYRIEIAQGDTHS